MSKEYLSTKEVSDMTGLSVPTLQRWVSERRELPFIKAGKRVLYDPKDITEYMGKNKVRPENNSDNKF